MKGWTLQLTKDVSIGTATACSREARIPPRVLRVVLQKNRLVNNM
jgi:hypothetical protein